MHLKNRTVSAVVSLAVGATLAVGPALLAPASAGPVPSGDARMAVTAECAAARTGLASAQSAKARAHKAVVKAKKKLRKAKHSHRPARIKKAKRVLKNARHRYALRYRAVNTQNKRVAYACAAPTSATRANATGQKVDLLVLATGTVTDLIGSLQLSGLLDRLLPGVSGLLSPAQLTSLTGGFNTGPLSLDDATALLGGSFSPTEIQSILGGTASPALVLDLASHIVGQLNEMVGGVLPVPGGLSVTDLTQTFAGVFGALDVTQLGGLVDLLLAATGHGGTTLDLTKLTNLLDGLIPGLSGTLTAGQKTAMLNAVNGASLDPTTLSNLLGGQFSPAQLTPLLGGLGADDLKGMVLGSIVAQLGTLDGSALALPGTLSPSALTQLVSDITSLVGDVIASIPILGPVVCAVLPFLC